ncbi:MAG: hypothetical protein RL693_929 [Verrucomicrobiota bacterium]|jgi:hypothetical protein
MLSPSPASSSGKPEPFDQDICVSSRKTVPSVPLHEEMLASLLDLKSQGRLVILTSTQAGSGKTHLLSRMAEALKEDTVVITLPWQSTEGLSWAATGRAMLMDLFQGDAGTNHLQELCGAVHTTLLCHLIETGRVPSADAGQIIQALAQSPLELFSESGPAKPISEWFRDNFPQLRQILAECCQLPNLPMVEEWLQLMFEYTIHPTTGALATMQERMEKDGGVQVPCFLSIATHWKPLVLIADHMDGLFHDQNSGTIVAQLSATLAALPRVQVVLSMNEDLWESAFGRQLPSALASRLQPHRLSLPNLNHEEIHSLLRQRMQLTGESAETIRDFLEFLDAQNALNGLTSPRAVLRKAAAQWQAWLSEGTIPPPKAREITPPLLKEEQERGGELSRLARMLAEVSVKPAAAAAAVANPTEADEFIPEPLMDDDEEPGFQVAPEINHQSPAAKAASNISLLKLREMINQVKAPNNDA